MSTAILEQMDRIELAVERLLNLQLGQFGEALPEPTTNKKTWITAEEAAEILGLPITSSRTHTRRLRWYRDRGFLTKFQGRRPISYLRSDVEKLAKRIKNSEVIIPPVI
jgi:hypothetical protein